MTLPLRPIGTLRGPHHTMENTNCIDSRTVFGRLVTTVVSPCIVMGDDAIMQAWSAKKVVENGKQPFVNRINCNRPPQIVDILFSFNEGSFEVVADEVPLQVCVCVWGGGEGREEGGEGCEPFGSLQHVRSGWSLARTICNKRFRYTHS